jgi:LPS O-antigen subunit length determinant protein (WzzB/FepE family)
VSPDVSRDLKERVMTDQNQKSNNFSPVSEGKIDLLVLSKILWKRRKKIAKSVLIFMIIGLFIAIFSEKEYSSSTTFVPQTSDANVRGNLGGLASLVGINLGALNTDEVISPSLYAEIVNSIPVQKKILATELSFEGYKEKIPFQDYYENYYNPGVFGYLKKYTIGLPKWILKKIKPSKSIDQHIEDENKEIWHLTENEVTLIEKLEEIIKIDYFEENGYILIETSLPEALASAELTFRVQELLQDEIISFKIKKSKNELTFIQDRYAEKEKEFQRAQEKLAVFKDKNMFVNSELAKTKFEILYSEFMIKQKVLEELSKQLESQKILVKKNTPVFTVLKPVSVPTQKTKPKRLVIVIVWLFLGFVFGACKYVYLEAKKN